MTGPTGVDVDALADEVAHTRARWHAARQARADALHAFDDATRDEMRAAEAHAAAVAQYEAHKGWRS